MPWKYLSSSDCALSTRIFWTSMVSFEFLRKSEMMMVCGSLCFDFLSS